MKTILFTILASFALASPTWAEEATDIDALKKQIQALQEQVQALQNKPQAEGPLSRFDGRWEGKIIGDKRYDCRDGEIKLTIAGGKVEGTRTFFSGYPAPVKGSIKPNGSYSGYQNRIDVTGQFAETTADMWYVDGSCENKVVLQRTGS